MSGLIMSAANQRQQCQICEGKNSRQIGWNDTVVTSTNDFFAIVLCIVEEWNPLLFLFLQRNFKILGKLYSKFGRLWWTACPLGMRYKQKQNILDKLVEMTMYNQQTTSLVLSFVLLNCEAPSSLSLFCFLTNEF